MKSVFIVDGARTPFLKMRGKPGSMTASDLSVACARPLLARQPFKATDLDEVVVGCVGPKASETNIGRLIALRLGCGPSVPGWTVQRNCASGLQAIDCAATSIASGRHHLVLAGGAEAMSHAPLLYSEDFVSWLSELQREKKWNKRLKTLLSFRPRFLIPVVSLLKGLTDPFVHLGMGQTAEELAYRFGISRREMDELSVLSHQRATLACSEQRFQDEIIPLFSYDGQVVQHDDGIRSDSNVEKLAKLKPVFDRFGNITAGNSSQITDGAAFVVMASEEAVKKYHLPILGEIKQVAWAGVEPQYMGLGPVHAISQLLTQQSLSLKDIQFIEINEAFAAQILACQRAFQDPDYCEQFLGGKEKAQTLNLETLNVDGGAISIGHPVGASGVRLVLHLLHILKLNQAKRGIASLCIGGGQGGAVLVERPEGE